MRALAAVLALALLVAAPAGALAGDAHTAVPVPGPVRGPVADAPLPAPPGKTTLLTKGRNGGFANNGSLEPSMSANGRFVAFTSVASNLVANDREGTVEVFVLDRTTGKVTRAPLPEGVERRTDTTFTEPSISADGRIVAFTYKPPPPLEAIASFVLQRYVLVWDRQAGTTEYLETGIRDIPRPGYQPSVSADGRYVAFTSTADAPGDKDGGEEDVLRRDRRTGQTVLVSAGFGGEPISGIANSPSISGNGNLVAFVSDGGDSVVNEDTGSGLQVYVRDVAAGRTEQVSATPDGRPPRDESTDPAISGNGRYVAFASRATNLTPEGSGGLFRRDRRTDTTIMVSVTPADTAADGSSAQPSITTDGNYIAWTSNAPDLVPETAGRIAPAAVSRIRSEVFLRDIAAGETILISVSTRNTGGGGRSFLPSVAGGGRYVAFASDSPELVRVDENETYDVFLRDLPPVPVINPATLDLGAATVGSASPPLAATLGNVGWSPLAVTGASITGTNKADFRLVADGCRDRVLTRGQACTVSVTFTPKAKGSRAATLAVADRAAGSPRTVRLRGRATEVRRFNPKVELDPPIGQPGIVTIARGTGFPPNTPVRLAWTMGITPKLDPVVTDAAGTFEVPVLVFHNDRTGRRDLRADAVDGSAFPATTAEMLVTKPSVVPPRFEILRIVDVPLVLVIRG